MKLGLVTDSTSDLTESFLRERQIAMAPLLVEYDHKSFRDRIDLDAREYLSLLPTLKTLPHTSAPSPGVFRALYEEEFQRGREAILSIHLGSGLSSTVRSAEMAARMVSGRIWVIDGGSASLGTGLLVWWAHHRFSRGASLDSVLAEIEMLKRGLFALMAPNTLEYLARGGRIGQAARLVGTLLDMKPILLLEHGSFKPAKKVRGERQIISAMLNEVYERVPAHTSILAAIAHSGDIGIYERAREMLMEHYQVLGWQDGVIGPVISTHVGPGTFGIIVLPIPGDMTRYWEEGVQ